MNIKKIFSKKDIENIKDIYIYGAAISGKKILDIFEEWGINIAGFIDDNIQKQREGFGKWRVFSFSNIPLKKEQPINIIVGSIYFNAILRNIETRCTDGESVYVYDIRNLILDDGIRVCKQFIKCNDKKYIDDHYDELYKICSDPSSKNVLDVMKWVYDKQYIGPDVFDEICSDEACYFPSFVQQAIRGRRISIIDAGACKGELIGDIYRFGIEINQLFMFEIESENFEILKKNVNQSTIKNQTVLVKKGLWSEAGKLHMMGEGELCKIVPYETESSIDIISIDGYLESVENRPQIDMIKMDIEGSELEAIKGAINTILTDRPILAICIYHSPDDFVGIPIFLSERLNDYAFRILHHTITYGESILYAIPKEIIK